VQSTRKLSEPDHGPRYPKSPREGSKRSVQNLNNNLR